MKCIIAKELSAPIYNTYACITVLKCASIQCEIYQSLKPSHNEHHFIGDIHSNTSID